MAPAIPSVVLWALLAMVEGREVVLDTFHEKAFCIRAALEENLLERALQIESGSVRCWPYLPNVSPDYYSQEMMRDGGGTRERWRTAVGF